MFISKTPVAPEASEVKHISQKTTVSLGGGGGTALDQTLKRCLRYQILCFRYPFVIQNLN